MAGNWFRGLQRILTLDAIQVPREKLLFEFKAETDIRKWAVTSDQTIGGFSRARMETTKDGTGLFSGTLSNKLPSAKDVVRSGYAAMRSKPLPNTHGGIRRQNIDIWQYDSLEVKLRGDGRAYFLNITTDGLQPEDVYQSFIYTVGGPEWEVLRFPLDEFLLTSRGIIQNEQMKLNPQKVRTIGFMLADGLDGPFSLELAHIKASNAFVRTRPKHEDPRERPLEQQDPFIDYRRK
eukprot:comp11585_c0_seq1/m.6064 comp11585_c0_seq1/g.6064  ORF comp11585_c0_seq1/g.6064 comp11585_c0_seq1/m.6064 type:complete len:235 (-) comp11585_c0_seq1:513-1217(-)